MLLCICGAALQAEKRPVKGSPYGDHSVTCCASLNRIPHGTAATHPRTLLLPDQVHGSDQRTLTVQPDGALPTA